MSFNDSRQTECRRCGTCCMKGGPTLHVEDLPLLIKGKIDQKHLYTLRKGEIARNIDDRLMPLAHEIVKIRGRGDQTWTCMFYDDQRQECTIYSYRPAECRALKCWDPTDFSRVMARPYIQRSDVIPDGSDIQTLIEAHEARCGYGALEEAVHDLQSPQADKAASRVIDLLRYDHTVRSLVPEKLKLQPDTMDFFFGRPMTATLHIFGLEVRQEGNGYTLMPIQTKGKPE